jgi:UDP-GlcNAc:undecaprenyl-phosphate/decaprenyl-phosphate GlcNAc-1-phosphate transferase
MYSYLLSFTTALVVSFVITPFVRSFAKKKGWVDIPDHRKIHKFPIPRVGGIGIYCAFVVAVIPILFVGTAVSAYLRNNIHVFVGILVFSGFILLIGLWDDLKNISAWKKFSAQSFVAILCWLAGFQINTVWLGSQFQLVWILSLALTVLWIVGITNAFNLIDGMDGLAAGAALFATLATMTVSVVGDYKLSAVILAALAGAILGFLRYNFNPASVFLGDSGSYLLGFILGLVSIRYSQKSSAVFSIAIPIVTFGLPVLDTGLAIIRRFLKGKPIFSADMGHIHHVLIKRGLKTRHAVMLLYGISGLFGLFSLCFLNPSGRTNGVILAMLGVCVLLGVQQLRYSELHGLREHLFRGLQNQRALVAGSIVIRQMMDQMREAKTPAELISAIGSGLEELCFSRFELAIRDIDKFQDGSFKEEWEIIPLESGGKIFRWNSFCRSCEKTGFAMPGSSCENCECIKNPTLQKNMHWIALNSADSSDCQIALPLEGREHENVGFMKFYYPSKVEYPISAISILSQDICKEFALNYSRIIALSAKCAEIHPSIADKFLITGLPKPKLSSKTEEA